eukprot:4295846-Pyramimonas_sp.AAC.1
MDPNPRENTDQVTTAPTYLGAGERRGVAGDGGNAEFPGEIRVLRLVGGRISRDRRLDSATLLRDRLAAA